MAKYYLQCSDCGERRQASPTRFKKWQIRLANPKTMYLCKTCRPNHPKMMRVTIPDECIPMAGQEEVTGVIRQVTGVQILAREHHDNKEKR